VLCVAQYLFTDGYQIGPHVFPIGEAATALTGLAGRVSSDTLLQLTSLTGEVAAGVDPVGCAVFIGSSAVAGVIQDRAVDAAALADLKRSDLVDRYRDDPDWKGIVSVWALTKLGKLLPDGEAWNDAIIESATGDHDRLLALLQTYRDDPAKREAWEQTVEAVFTGQVDPEANGDFIDYLVRQFDTDDREEAVELFLDVGDLLGSKALYDELDALEGVEAPSRTALQAALSDGQAQVWQALNRDLAAEGFQRLTAETVRLPPRKAPIEAWQEGMTIRQFHDGIAYERPLAFDAPDTLELDGARQSPAAVAELLAATDGPGILIQGPPGAGKTTLLQNVVYRWCADGHGMALYRRSGGEPFDQLDTLLEAIDQADEPVLVAVSDAARPDASSVYRLMYEYRDDPTVTFLLDSRLDEWAELDPATSRKGDMVAALTKVIEALHVTQPAALTEADCTSLVETYERTTGRQASLAGVNTAARGASLHERLQAAATAGQMLHVAFLLTGTEGFEHDAEQKAAIVETPTPEDRPGFDPDLGRLIRHQGLLIAALGAIDDRTMRREYLYAVAAELSAGRGEGYHGDQVDRLLRDGFAGWMLFDGSRTRRYRTYHEFWSYWYLRTLVTDDVGPDAGALRDRLARCLASLRRLHAGELDRAWQRDIHAATRNLPATTFTLTADEDAATADDRVVFADLLDALYGLADRYPGLADLLCLDATDLDRLTGVLRDTCAPARVARYAITVATAYNAQGRLEQAREQLAIAADLLDGVEDPPPEVVAARHYGMAAVHKTEGDYDATLAALESARAHLTDADSAAADRLFANIAQMTGDVHSVQSEFDTAREWYDRITERRSDESLAAVQADRLGSVARKRGDLATAGDHYARALETARAVGDRATESMAARHVALANRRQVQAGEYDSDAERAALLQEAATRLAECRRIAEQLGDDHELAAVLGNLSLVRLLQDQPAAAETLATDGIEIAQAMDKAPEVAWLRNNRGRAYLAQDELAAAEAEFEQSRALNQQVGNQREEARSLRGLADVADARGEQDRAAELRTDAEQISAAIGDEHAPGDNGADE
jgi:tetratricopeptide (TPR) repeat protein